MSFNLNDNSLTGSVIFNNGVAGRVTNVTLTNIERKQPTDNPTNPDFKFIWTDPSGATVNDGVYRFQPNSSASEEQNQRSAGQRLGRLLTIAKCFVDPNFQFPDTSSMSVAQIEDVLINVIENNKSDEKKVNLFVNYGRKSKPQAYLRVRMFNFIEPSSVTEEQSRLVVNLNDDNMVRFSPDTPSTNNDGLNGQAPSTDANSFWK